MSDESSKETMLIWTDPATNKNRFYHVTMDSNGVVQARYGRVGEEGKLVNVGRGEGCFNSTVSKKKRKGYKEAAIVTNTAHAVRTDLREATNKTLLAKNSDPRLVDLVNRLVAVNAHEILQGSGGKLTVDDGQIRTPLGLLTEEAIQEARGILTKLEKRPSIRRNILSDYMTLVPQNVGRGREWLDTFLSTPDDIAKQAAFLTQLEQSLEFAKDQKKAGDDKETNSYEDLFRYQIAPMDDGKVFKNLSDWFAKTRKRGHADRLYNARLENVFTFVDSAADIKFEAMSGEIGNVIDAWHGTRAMNLLSIASRGLKSPREMNSLATTGALFGRGIYSSTCSTKSLGYADAGVWGGSIESRHYMFAVEVALGNTFTVKGHVSSAECERIMDGKIKDGKGQPYNSISAESGAMNLRNPETIVPNASQMRIKYLLEFTSK